MMSVFKAWIFNFIFIFRYAGQKPKRYAGGIEKKYVARLWDLLNWLIVESDCNRHYYIFGANQLSAIQLEYIGKKHLLRIKDKVDSHWCVKYDLRDISYDLITKDKFVFYTYMQSCNVPTAQVKYIIYGDCRNLKGEVKSIDSVILELGACVIKNTLLEGGEGFLYCKLTENHQLLVNDKQLNFVELKKLLSKGSWIVQEVMQSHSALRSVNSSALNITRIVTIKNGSAVKYLGGFQAFGTGNALNDSWANGSIYVGFNHESGQLYDHGYYHVELESKTVTSSHPDSQVEFSDFTIPFISEAIRLCIHAHEFLPCHFLIGWDVAITEKGPILLEANERPGMNAVQIFEGGLRKTIIDCAENTINYINKDK